MSGIPDRFCTAGSVAEIASQGWAGGGQDSRTLGGASWSYIIILLNYYSFSSSAFLNMPWKGRTSFNFSLFIRMSGGDARLLGGSECSSLVLA